MQPADGVICLKQQNKLRHAALSCLRSNWRCVLLHELLTTNSFLKVLFYSLNILEIIKYVK